MNMDGWFHIWETIRYVWLLFEQKLWEFKTFVNADSKPKKLQNTFIFYT